MKNKKNLKHRVLRGLRLVAVAGAMAMYSATAMATVANDQLPTNPQFTANIEKITSANGVMTVDQNKVNAAIHWDTFNVGANATVNFNYHGKQEGAYNILNFSNNNGAASEIYGRLKAGADANVWLVNPNGVIIGKGAQIDVGHMHLATHDLVRNNLTDFAEGNNDVSAMGTHTNAELMSMGNMYVNSISFDGNRVVLDADKLYTYAGDKVELGDKGSLGSDDLVHNYTATDRAADIAANKTPEQIQAAIDAKSHVTQVYLGEGTSNNTKLYAQKAATASGNAWTGDALNNNSYLTIDSHAKEVVVGYSVYDANATGANGKGTYENSANWRALYTTLADANGTPKAGQERVGFAWVEDSTQLERIGEGTKTLGRDFALKDGIAAVNTKEMNPIRDGSGNIINYAGFQPIGADPINEQSSHKTPFTGKFDGLNYDIYGLTINRPDEDDIGMFGHVGNGAVIRNVNLVSGAIVGNNKVGGVVGHAVGNITIENVKNSARVLGVENVGGIVGKAEGTSASAAVNIINAENVALIRGNVNVGGIVGNGSYVTVTGETFNTGAVKGIVNYQEANTAYATKNAAELTEATYDLINATPTNYLAAGTRINLHKNNGATENYFVLQYVTRGGEVIKLENVDNDLTNLQVGDILHCTYYNTQKKIEIEKKGVSGTNNAFTMRNLTDGNTDIQKSKVSLIAGHTVLEKEDPSHNVGGIAGSVSNSSIGNADADDFTIYNDVEIKAGYNIGGIAGSIAGTTIQNVINNGGIYAEGYTSESYNPTGRAQQNASADMNVANVGGIVGIANRGTTVNTISNVSNIADVTTATEKKTQYAITNVNKNDVTQDTSVTKTYDYYNAGNVGGIVGSAEYTVIDYANNKENKVTGAANIGGIVGKMQYTQVTNSVNDGGRIIGTGAIQGGAVTGTISYGTLNTNMLSSGDNVVREYYFGANKSKGSENIIVGNIGGIAGYVVDALDDSAANPKSHITNSRNRGDVSPGEIIDPANPNYIYDINMVGNVGGIAGKINRPVRSTSVATNFSAAEAALATIKVDQTTATVANSNNTGNISGYFGTGGVVGQSYNGEIANSYNLGAVKSAYANVSGQGQGAIQLGGLLGDGLEQVKDTNINSTTIIYNSYNAGTIGDSEFKNFGRHVGGVAGRFTGIIEKVYNIGDIYNASDTTGGIVGYLWGSPTTDRNMPAVIRNSFNAGNITVLAKAGANDFGVDVGGIVAAAGGGNTVQIENAYNLGVLRGFIDSADYKTPGVSLPGTGNITVAGIISGRNSNSIVGDKLYSTGELIGGYYNSSTGVIDTTNAAVRPIYSNGNGSNYSNAFYVKPADGSGFAIAPTQNNVSFIDYDKRYDISKYSGLGVYKADAIDGSTVQRANGGFRMYLYDQNDGVSVTYGATDHVGDTGYITKGSNIYKLKSGTTNVYEKLNSDDSTDPSVTVTVVGTMPIMNEFLPHIFGGGDANETHYLADKIGTGVNDVKYVQAGTEYNPLQLNIKMNTDGKTLDIDYAQSNMNRSAQINILNGNLNIFNISNPNFYMSGNYVALNGDITIAGSAERLNLSSNSNFYGKNVSIINNVGSIENSGNIYATAGNVLIKGQAIDNYGGITSAGEHDTGVTIKNVGAYSVGHITAINDPNVKVANKGEALYSVTSDTATQNGNITISTDIDGDGAGTAVGDINLYLGNNKKGLIATDGNVTIIGKNIYSDSDMKLGLHGKTVLTMKGDNIVLDFSNMGATYNGELPDGIDAADKKAYMLHTFVKNFSGTTASDSEIKFLAQDGISKTNAMMVLDYFDDDNTLNLKKYDIAKGSGSSVLSLQDQVGNMNISNGTGTLSAADKKRMAFAVIENVEQLGNIQLAYEGINTPELKAAYTNYQQARKDVYELTEEATNESKVQYAQIYAAYLIETDSTQKTNLLDQVAEIATASNIPPAEVAKLQDAVNRVSDNRKILKNAVTDTSVMAMNYTLRNSLDASEVESFKSLGLNADGTSTAFTGIFDGRGNNINSVNPKHKLYDEDIVNNTGLFAAVGQAGVVKNLNINASRLESTSTRVGLIAGTNQGTISNVNTFGNTIKDHAVGLTTPAFIGGLVGFNDVTGVIANSKSEDIVFSESSNEQVDVGGIAGMNVGIVHNATGKSDVSVSEGGATSLGGVVGVNAGLLKDVVVIGVTAGLYERQGVNLGKVVGAANVGGIAGENRTKYLTSAGEQTANANFYIKENADGTYSFSSSTAIEGAEVYAGGTITDAYNDSKVKGWSNTGGVVGRNFGVGDTTSHGNLTMTTAANVQYVANAADVVGGENVGGLIGTNNANVKGVATTLILTDEHGNKYTMDANGAVVSAVNANNEIITVSEAKAQALKDFKNTYLDGTEHEISQVIYGRNSGKITAKYGMEQGSEISKGQNVGGLMGVSGTKADVEGLLNGKASSVYGATNVGGLIGENQGVLQKSTNLMQNNEIAGAWQVGGIVGNNTGVIVGLENTNKFNITTNTDYVSATNGQLNAAGIAAVTAIGVTSPVYASYFGGVVGHNATEGVVGDVVNYADVTINRPAHYVGGVIGRNDGTIAAEGADIANPAGDGNLSINAKGYLRNNGEVGVMHIDTNNIIEGGKYIGGVIGENNSAISNVDITNNIGGSVTGDQYVGGIIGKNTAAVAGGRDAGNNYYKYDVYNNGKVVGTENVGGLVGENAADGSLTLAYNTGVVTGVNNVGGIVGTNAGSVDQVFNSTAPYDKNGVEIVGAGVNGTTNVGGLVGVNSGTITNAYNDGKVTGETEASTGAVVGSNAGTLAKSWANVVYDASNNNITIKLVGANSGTLTNNYSVSEADGNVAGQIIKLSVEDMVKEARFDQLAKTEWAFYNNAATPLLKNFLTKAYFVPNGIGDAFVYNGKNQGAGIKIENGHVNVYKVVDGVMTDTKVGEIFAADASGDHSLADYILTRNQNALNFKNEAAQLIVGKADAVDANRYNMLYSHQINTQYNNNVKNKDGVVERVVNPNMLGYEFEQAKLNDTSYDPTAPVYDPSKPNYDPADPNSNPKGLDKENPGPVPGKDDFTPQGIIPTYDINKAIITASGNDVTRTYGNTALNGDKYAVTINPEVITADDKTKLQNILGTDYMDKLFSKTTPDLATEAGRQQDKGLTGAATGTVTKNANVKDDGVEDYKWNGSYALKSDYATGLNAEQKTALDKVLYNYALKDENKKDFEQVSMGTGVAEGNSYVTKAELNIKIDDKNAITYGDAVPAWTSSVGSDAATPSLVIKNGDTLADILSYAPVSDAAVTVGSEIHTNNVGTYDITQGTVTENSKYNNYNVTFDKGSITINQRTLTVTGQDVSREYGVGQAYVADDNGGQSATAVNISNLYGANITGWAYNEKTTLEGGLVANATKADGAITGNTTGKITNDVNRKGVAGEGGYNWTSTLNLKNGAGDYFAGLQNYTFVDAGGNKVASTILEQKSYVTPHTITMKVDDLHMIYGATESGTTKTNDLYGGQGKVVYETNAQAGYNISANDGTTTYNGDDLSTIVNKAGITWTNTGFYDSGEDAGHTKDVNVAGAVGEGNTYELRAQNVNSNTKNYNIVMANGGKGDVKVEYAILTGGANPIFRYYGEDQKYTYNQTTGKFDKLGADEGYGRGTLHGFAYGEEANVTDGLTWGGAVTVDDHAAVVDGAVTGLTGTQTITKDVGKYSWTGGSINVTDNADLKAAVFKNYRFWDTTANGGKGDVSTATTVTNGADSYVLPQTIMVNLKNQTITYGDALADSQKDYFNTGILNSTNPFEANYKGEPTNSFIDTVSHLIVANGDKINTTDLLNAINKNDIAYKDGKAYIESGAKTNNVGTYTDAVTLKDGVLATNTIANVTYKSFDIAGGKNYNIVINDGDVTINQKELKVSGLYGEIDYGAKGGASDVKNITNATIQGGGTGAYGESVGFYQGSAVGFVAAAGGNYLGSKAEGADTAVVKYNGEKAEANIVAYDNSINRVVGLTNSNYKLVDADGNALTTVGDTQYVVGALKVLPVEIEVSLNNFTVLYGDQRTGNTINADYTRPGVSVKAAEKEIKYDAADLKNGDSIGNVIELKVDTDGFAKVSNDAFTDEGKTKNVGTGYTLTVAGADTNLKETTTKEGYAVAGLSASGNYKVSVKEGSVDVIAKKVVIVNPGDPTPTPSDDPDRVYVKAEDVKRVYGNTALTDGTAYQVKVDNLTSWDAASQTKDVAVEKVTVDGGVKTSDTITVATATETSNAADTYTWNTNILDTLGTNYVLDDTSKVVTGKSKVDKATIVYKLSDHTNANSNAIAYGTVNHKDYIDYSGAVVDASGIRADGKSYATTYTSTANKLAAQDAGKTLDDIFSYTDENTGYNTDGTGKDVTYDGTNKNFYAHNAIDFKGSGTAEYIGDDNVTADHSNIGKTYVKGTSYDGNYNVIIVSGDVEFNKKQLDASVNVVGQDETRVYGNKEAKTYTAAVTSGLVNWDNAKDKGVTVSGVIDGAIATGTATDPKKTSNKGDYTWTGSGALSDELAKNYDLTGTITAGSAVTPANLTVYLNDFAITYGDVDKDNKTITATADTITSGATIGAAEKQFKYSTTDGTGLVNGDDSTTLVINKVVNEAYVDANRTNNVGNDYKLSVNIADGSTTSGTKLIGNDLYTANENYKLTIVDGKVDVLQKHIILKVDDVTMQYGSVEDDHVVGTDLKENQAGIATNDISSLYKLVDKDGNQVVNGDDLSSIINNSNTYTYHNTGFDNDKTKNVGTINNGLYVVGSVVSNNDNYVIDNVERGNVTITHALLAATGGTVYRYYGDANNMYTANENKTELTKTNTYAISTDNIKGIVYGQDSVKNMLIVNADGNTKDYSKIDGGTANVGEHDWSNGEVAYADKEAWAQDAVASNYRLWNAGFNDDKGAVVAINEADKANIVVNKTEVGKTTEGADISGKAYVLPVLYTNAVTVNADSIEYGSVQSYDRPAYESLGTGSVKGANEVSGKITLGGSEYTGAASNQATANMGAVTTALSANGFDNGALVEVDGEWRTNNVKYGSDNNVVGYAVSIKKAELKTYTDALGRTYQGVDGNANYIVAVTETEQKVTPKTVTVDGLSGHIMYGKQDSNELQLDDAAGGYVNGLVYGDSLSYTLNNATVAVKEGTTAYNTNKQDRTTADYGTYADSMKVTGEAKLTGDKTTLGNYVLSNTINGTIKVNSAELTINMNDFAIVYGDVDKNKTITATSTANPHTAGVSIAQAEKEIKENGLVNGDTTSGVAITGVINGAYVVDTHTQNAGLDYTLQATSTSGTVTDGTGTYTTNRNYKIVAINDGKVDVVPKKLEVTTKSVTRVYGTDTVGDSRDSYVTGITGFVNDDTDALKSDIAWTRNTDGAVDGVSDQRITNDVSRSGVQGEGGYDWTGTLKLTGDALLNYTFGNEGAARVESLNATNKSYVTPYHISIKANDITMIYGAYENDHTGHGLTTNGDYANAGMTVYDNLVAKAYIIVDDTGKATYNGDTLANVITLKDGTSFKNTGFDSNGHTVDAKSTGKVLTFIKGSEAATKDDFNVNKNYVIDSVGSGNVNIEYALLEAKGDDVYRYYGETTMYKKVGNNLEVITSHPVASHEVTGWAYDEGENIVSGTTKKMKDLLTTNVGTSSDGAVTGLSSGKVTNDVNVNGYTWSDGTLTAEEGAMSSDGALKNYRFWKNNAAVTTGGVMGGASYVLPQVITITLNSQVGGNAIEYGSAMSDNINASYAGIASVTGNYRGNTIGAMVDGTTLKANGDNINVATVLAGQYEYAVGNDKAYTATDKTNNVYNADNSKATYNNSIVLKDGSLVDKGITFDPYGNTSYKALAADTSDGGVVKGNYVVKVVNGSVELNPRALTVEQINGSVVYGDQNNTGIVTSDPTLKDNRVIAGDTVNLIKGAVTAADNLYTKNDNVVRTGNAGTYNDKLTTKVSVDNKNYILVDNLTDKNTIDSIHGDLTITPAELVVTLNSFNVMYGDVYSDTLLTVDNSGTLVRTGTTVNNAEKVTLDWQGLTNGNTQRDSIFAVTSANNVAFKDYDVNGSTVKGTKEVGTYNLFAGSTNVKNNAKIDYAHGTVKAGLSADGNYNVTINKGSVNVLAKPVEVVGPNEDLPTDSNGIKVYVKAEEVQRTYGNTDITNTTDKKYHYTVSGLASWEAASVTGVIDPSRVGTANDGGLVEKDDVIRTNNANTYTWNVGLNSSDIAGLGSNYLVNGVAGGTTANIIGNSVVDKATLTVTLNNVVMAYGSTEGDASGTSTYDKAGVATTNIANQYGYTVSGAVNGDANDKAFVNVTNYNNAGFANSEKTQTNNVVYGSDNQPIAGYQIDANAASNNNNYIVELVKGDVTITPAILTANGKTVYRTYGDIQMYSSSQYNADGTLKSAAERENDKISTYSHGNITGFLSDDENLSKYVHVDENGPVYDEALKTTTTTNNANVGVHHYEWKEGLLEFNTTNATEAEKTRLNNYRFYDEDEQGATANKYLTKTSIEGKSYVERAQLTVKLSDHKGVVYGVSEDMLKPSYSASVIDGTYASRSNGLAAQDSTLTLNDIVTYTHENTGYVNGEGQAVKDYAGNTIEYQHTTGTTDLENLVFDAQGNLKGVSRGGNYDVTFVNGTVTFKERPVVYIQPGDPDPVIPGYDSTYDPTNADDPRNKVYIGGNRVERTEGNVKDMYITNSDGSKTPVDYKVDKVFGLPSWLEDKITLGVNVNTIPDDKGVISETKTNVVGDYQWSGTLTGLDLYADYFDLGSKSVLGASIVNPLPYDFNVFTPVEDIYPWLHRTNGDHGWGHQDHERERKAEVRFVDGGADFFNDRKDEKEESKS